MIRKVIKQGPSTLVVSLPSKWVKKNQIKQGDEILIEEEDNKIQVSPTNLRSKEKSITVETDNMYGSTIIRLVNSAYKSGYDEIRVVFKNDKIDYKRETNIRDFIEDITSYLIGFEITSQTKNRFVLRQISGTDTESFESVASRVLFMIKEMFEQLDLGMEDSKELEKIKKMDKNINKFTNYGLRILNKSKSERKDYYAFMIDLERIGDYIEDISKTYTKTKKVKEVLKATEEYYTTYMNLFLKYSIKKADEICRKKRELKTKIKEIKKSTPKEAETISKITEILNTVTEGTDVMIAANLE